MKFFKPEDFYSRNFIQQYIGSQIAGKTIFVHEAAEFANDKLEKEGRVVYGVGQDKDGWAFSKYPQDNYKAILINTKPIEKCNHPKEKVRKEFWKNYSCSSIDEFKCECGARVEPAIFEACEEK